MWRRFYSKAEFIDKTLRMKNGTGKYGTKLYISHYYINNYIDKNRVKVEAIDNPSRKKSNSIINA